MTDRVEPQDGQGIPVACFMIQILAALLCCSEGLEMPQYRQIYPARQPEIIKRLNLFLTSINIKYLEVFSCFFHALPP